MCFKLMLNTGMLLYALKVVWNGVTLSRLRTYIVLKCKSKFRDLFGERHFLMCVCLQYEEGFKYLGDFL